MTKRKSNSPEAELVEAPWKNAEEKKEIQYNKAKFNLEFALERAKRARDVAQKDIERLERELDKLG